MNARIIDGKAAAQSLRKQIGEDVKLLSFRPGLAVVLIGDDAASQVYVRSKVKQTREVGMASFEYRLPDDTDEATLLDLIAKLNTDDAVDGILVQLPCPPHIRTETVLNAIDPAKDVDGFHPVNVGMVATGTNGIVPCTPLGCLLLLHEVHEDLSGMNAVILGRSNIVGKPMAQLLLRQNCSVTIIHSRSHDIPAICRSADILIAAVGRREMVRGDWIKPGATIIDVGINRITNDTGQSRLIGDVAFDEAVSIADAITPVPGGVGPMTIACLLLNTLSAAKARRTI